MIVPLTKAIATGDPGAVGSFNVLDADMALAIADAAEAQQRPVVIGIASRHFTALRTPLIIPAILKIAEQCRQPVALHLDHAGPGQLEMIQAALDLGFTSIMIDGSDLSLRENIRISQTVVRLCRGYQASVEGELGGIAGEEGVADQGMQPVPKLPYTDPREAAIYATESGVDALAIAVGTAHGIYQAAPEISFFTIEAVRAVVPVPLVLHGATGVRPIDVQHCVTCGIRKINFFSGFLQAAMDRLRGDAPTLGFDYLAMKSRLSKDWRRVAEEQIALFANESNRPSRS